MGPDFKQGKISGTPELKVTKVKTEAENQGSEVNTFSSHMKHLILFECILFYYFFTLEYKTQIFKCINIIY